MTLRVHDPVFESYADAHLAQVEKIVAKHQINHGGTVLMAQLENEHKRAGALKTKTPISNTSSSRPAPTASKFPSFLSGLHHGGEPAGENPYSIGRFSLVLDRFWTGWIGKYGDMEPGMLNEKIRGTWKIIAFGGAGYDYYMVHGGTIFVTRRFVRRHLRLLAPIGETGQFHNLYFPARRAAGSPKAFPLLTAAITIPISPKPMFTTCAFHPD